MINSNIQNESGGEDFGQYEPLVVRLAGIIRDYPEGVGIIQELIQNADDAKATRVEITLDWRTHQAENLPDQRMTALMGPAILAYNDSVFTKIDFDSIRSLGHSEKAQDLQKTGRFGVGFNAVYHVTDYPSFISRDRIVFFDPHSSAIPGTSKEKTGKSWKLRESNWWTEYPDFMKIYQAGGLPDGEVDFQGTLFRLPLRTEEQAKKSEIRQQAFGEDNVREIIQKLSDNGEEILLFLKSVLEISFSEIAADSDGTRTELLTIWTKNKKTVQRERQKLIDIIPDDTDTLLKKCRNESGALASVSYRHEIEKIIRSQETTNTTWRVVSIIGCDSEGEVADAIAQMQAQKEKAVPWAGAAARIYSSNDETLKPITGKAYCFLPTPIETGLPIHINGFFNLNSARDNLSSDSGQTGRDQIKPLWNQVLVRNVLSVACANLIADLVWDIGESNPEYFYQLWPVSTNNRVLENLPSRVIQLLSEKRVICSAVAHLGVEKDNGKKVVRDSKWVIPTQIKVLSSKNWWNSLLDPLSADEIDIPNPYLSDAIITAFKDAGCPLEKFTPAKLREYLKEDKPLGVPLVEAPKPSLQNRDWVIEMLRYCVSDKHKNLTGLPLAILVNNTLQVFGYNPIGTIYIADEKAMRIFANQPQWFLDPNLERVVPEIRDCSSVSKMDAKEVAQKLLHVIGSTPGGLSWQPDAVQPPNTNWLTQVYRYFTQVSSLPNEELKQVPLVPGNDGKLYKGGFVNTPLWCGDDINKEQIEALKYFGIPLVEAPRTLLKAIAEFIEKHPNKFICSVTGPKVADTLYLIAEKLTDSYHPTHHTALLNFLANPLWLRGQKKYSDKQEEILKKLRIYPTASHEIVSLIDDNNVYIPGGYKPPAVAGSLKLLLSGSKTSELEWLPLLQMLKVKTLVRFRLIFDCLLPSYANLNQKEQRTALAWIRDNLDDAKKEVSNPDELLTEIKKQPLVRCTDGQLQPATSIYSPESDVRKILGESIPLPDLNFYSNDSISWIKFFDSLGMRKTARADDILKYVKDLIKTANQNGADAVADSCIKILDYFGKNWDKLESEKISNSGTTLAQALKEQPWLPVIGDPNKLKEYPGAKIPEKRLYRAEEVCFVDDAHLVASQKLIFNYQRTRIKAEIWKSLGFQEVNPKMVLDHFDTLITSLESK